MEDEENIEKRRKHNGIYILFLLFFIAFDLQQERRNNTNGERAGGKPQHHCSHEKPFWSLWTLYVSIDP
jgi:hypothetical protein